MFKIIQDISSSRSKMTFWTEIANFHLKFRRSDFSQNYHFSENFKLKLRFENEKNTKSKKYLIFQRWMILMWNWFYPFATTFERLILNDNLRSKNESSTSLEFLSKRVTRDITWHCVTNLLRKWQYDKLKNHRWVAPVKNCTSKIKFN